MKKLGLTGIQREVARRQGSPCTGKLSARPAGKPGIFLSLKESLRRSPLRHLAPTHIEILRRLSKRSYGTAESIWSDGVSKPPPNPGSGPSRLPPVGPEPR